MRLSLFPVLLPAFLLAALAAPAEETGRWEAEEPDPEALLEASARFLAERPAFAFEWFASHDEVVDGREKLTHLSSGRNLVDRAHGFVSSSEQGMARREYYYDGAVFTYAAPEEGFHASAAFEGGFDALLEAVRERTGRHLPLWTLMSPTLPRRFAEEKREGAWLGLVRVAGEPAHHLAFAGWEQDWQIWIAADPERPLPLKIVGTERTIEGWPQYRARLIAWDLDPETAPQDFLHVPEPGATAVSFPPLGLPPEAARDAAALAGKAGRRGGGGAPVPAGAGARAGETR
jgi:hypothetical protein